MFTLQKLLSDIFQNQKKFEWTGISNKFGDISRSSYTRRSYIFSKAGKTNRFNRLEILDFDI
jgi:hypothetical protein